MGIHMSEQAPSDTDILKTIEATEKSRNWISKHYDELRTKYEGKVFAVRGESVVDSSDSVTTLLEDVKKKGEDTAFLVIESIPQKGVAYIL